VYDWYASVSPTIATRSNPPREPGADGVGDAPAHLRGDLRREGRQPERPDPPHRHRPGVGDELGAGEARELAALARPGEVVDGGAEAVLDDARAEHGDRPHRLALGRRPVEAQEDPGGCRARCSPASAPPASRHARRTPAATRAPARCALPKLLGTYWCGSWGVS
jgi:hypothetical protein